MTPENTPAPRNRFPRILGDSLYFCDFRGQGRAGDIVLKDRYNSLWALDGNLELLWQAQCNTGHYPFAYDVDGDGKDELAIGYSLFDHDGNGTVDARQADRGPRRRRRHGEIPARRGRADADDRRQRRRHALR